MADDTSLKIHVSTDADVTGLNAAGESIRRIKVDISDLSDHGKRAAGILPPLVTPEQQAELKQVQDAIKNGFQPESWQLQADAAKKYGKEITKAGAVTKKFGNHIGSARLRGELFRRTLMSIGEYTPGAEYAVMGLGTSMGLLTAEIIGAAVVLETIKGKIKEFTAELDAQGDWAAQPLEDKWQQIQDATAKATEDVAKFNAARDQAGEDTDPISTALKNQKTLTDAATASAKKLLEARFALEEQAIRAHEADLERQGRGDKAGMQAQLDALKSRKDAAAGKIDSDAAVEAFHEKILEQANRTAADPILHAAAVNSALPAATAQADLVARNKRIKDNTAIIDPEGKAQQELAAAKKTVDDLQTSFFSKLTRMVISDYAFNAMHATDYQRVTDLQTKMDVAGKMLKSDQAEAARKDATDEAAIARHAADKTAADDNRKKLGEINRTMPADRAAYDEKTRADTAARLTGEAAGDIAANSHPQSRAEAITALKESARLGQELAVAAKDATAAHSQSLGTILAALNELKRSYDNLNARLNQNQTVGQ